MTGCEKYSNYSGYADTYRYDSNYIDDTPRDDLGRRKVQVIAMDAVPYYGDVQGAAYVELPVKNLRAIQLHIPTCRAFSTA